MNRKTEDSQTDGQRHRQSGKHINIQNVRWTKRPTYGHSDGWINVWARVQANRKTVQQTDK